MNKQKSSPPKKLSEKEFAERFKKDMAVIGGRTKISKSKKEN